MRASLLLAMALLVVSILLVSPSSADESPGPLALDFDPDASYEFDGPIGRRVDANARNWLVRAPGANPGLLGMFQLRDRQPTPALVPWAGEFVGKYLISAVQALRMSDDAELEATVRNVVDGLIAAQADDGYLGPFPKDARLLANWDLWGHYHCMLALMMWHDRTGDPAALETCVEASDLICDIYLDTDRRMLEAGWSEMNLAVIHALGRLYRMTGEPRYLRMMREIEEDWRSEGDYFQTAIDGIEFYRTPKPRWESLHNIQGLVELYRITGDERYRSALLHHWESIRRWDRRNTGGFTSGEKATGTPYEPTPIETCCTIAWMALTVDALRLSGNPAAADELERSTYNGMLGAQHPSGSWWTYNTPMDGVREASDHTIVFQARAGTPELNCCSVNAPRGLGMLSEWAVMRADDGLTVNYLGPMKASLKLADGTSVVLHQRTTYPLSGDIRLALELDRPAEFAVKVRIPGWATDAKILPPEADWTEAPRGTYFVIRRRWNPGDEIRITLEMPLRYESGDGPMLGRMSIYRGPILLAYDVARNDFDEDQLPVLTPDSLASARVSFPETDEAAERLGRFSPWLTVAIPCGGERTLRLCDFATAGSLGSRYRSWLPAARIGPPVPVPATPPNNAAVPSGRIRFAWRRSGPTADESQRQTFRVIVSERPDFDAVALESEAVTGWQLVLSDQEAARLKRNVDYFWKVVADNPHGSAESGRPAKRFRIDPSLPKLTDADLTEFGEGPDGILVRDALRGNAEPSFGLLLVNTGDTPAEGPIGQSAGAVALNGRDGMLVYKLREFPPRDYTVAVRFAYQRTTPMHLGHVFSAWAGGMDDPLRISVDGDKLYARIEAGSVYSTRGFDVAPDHWYHVCVVKRADRLTLYVNGKPVEELAVPAEIRSNARDFALGANPHYTDTSEHLAGRLSGFTFHVRAFSPSEVAELFDADAR